MASVALVGSYQQDNLALGYLAGYAESKGHTVHICRFDGPHDTARVVGAVQQLNPDAVGLAIPYYYAVRDVLALAEAIRCTGYSGHITCGGHVPTFCYEALLRHCPALDSVVRHEGEITLSKMLDALDKVQTLKGIDGVVWRDGDVLCVESPRAFVTELEQLPWPRRQDTPFYVSGLPIGFIIASRGCIGDCAYCSIRAFSKDAGGPLYRMRDPESVAREMASISRAHGTRLFMMEDDLFVLPSEKKTLERMGALKAALEQEGIGDLLFWVKARPETITPKVVDAAKQMGVAQIFLGVEQVTLERLRYLGRKHTPEDNVRAISLIREAGIQACFNLMMFDPDCSMEEVDAVLDFAGRYVDVPWNICRTEIYPGTRIFDRVKAENRLLGDDLTYGYKMRDPSCELLFRIMRVAFVNRSFNADGLINRMGSVLFTLEAHRQMNTPQIKDLVESGYDLLARVNRDTVLRLQNAAGFAKQTKMDQVARVQDYAIGMAMSMNDVDHGFYVELDQLFEDLAARVS